MSDEEKEPEGRDEEQLETGASKPPGADSGTEESPSTTVPQQEKGPGKEAESSQSGSAAGSADQAKAADKPEKPAKKPVKKPVKKKGLAYQDLENDALLEQLKERFGEAMISGQSFLDQATYTVSLDCLYDLMIFLRDSAEWEFDYLVDLTALDYLGDEKRFCMVYHLYSNQSQKLIRVKSRLEEDEVVPSVTSIWSTSGWMEREVYDLFGIEFSGHGNLKRILLPEDWHGHPLRKDYDIKLQDQAWIKKHLDIRKTPA